MPSLAPLSLPHEAATRPADRSDEELMLSFGRGDTAAFEALFARHERPVYRFLLRSVAIPALAEDLLQETWLAVARGAGGYEVRARFTTWLYGIARSRLIDHWRARDKAVVQSLSADEEEGGVQEIRADPDREPQNIAMDRAQARAFTIAVEGLPPAQREAFLLHAEAGLTIQEIGAIAGVSPETAKSRFRYACARLKIAMQDWQHA